MDGTFDKSNNMNNANNIELATNNTNRKIVRPNINSNTQTRIQRPNVNNTRQINNQNNTNTRPNRQVQNNNTQRENIVIQPQNQVRTQQNNTRTIQNNVNAQIGTQAARQQPVQRQNLNNTQQNAARQQNNLRQQQSERRQPVTQNNIIQNNTEQTQRISHMTRLQKQAAYGTDDISKISGRQDVGRRTLGEINNYELGAVSNNVEKLKKKRKKERPAGSLYLLLPLSILIILILIAIKIGIGIATQVKEFNISVVSPIGSVAIDKEQFVSYMDNMSLNVETDDIGAGITKTIAYDDKYTYEINFVEFASQEDASAYYNYMIDYADETDSSYSSSITGQKSAESTLISNTYNAFMDITYIENTLIIGIAYDSNKQDTVIEILNNLGY